MPYLPFHAKASNLEQCFNHLSEAALHRGAQFLERTPRGYPANPMRDFYIGKCGFLSGHAASDYHDLPHPSHYIAGWHQESSDFTVAVQSLKGNLPQGRR